MIHSQELVHRDLHSGNILQDNLHSAYIADLGLSISANIAIKKEKRGVYGILPYIAPEILEGEQYTTASDIYSFGIILWEILYGKSVFYEQKFGSQLEIQICVNNLRPTIIENTSRCYVNLMKECWERKPEKRPSAENICEIVNEWQNDENILGELAESEKVLNNTSISSVYAENLSEIIYESKLINYITPSYQDSIFEKWNIAET
ncbi:kinase-like domain-containing protein [Gigaspora rosea]|uniref:Kinase-like domain-containing protein n=1 Tax=Gigaspora rosea TaxID=44941 RepID=A0A397VVB8_9GLOM|nr:kinase-like domain-containing protein [Gigaspora rosea]